MVPGAHARRRLEPDADFEIGLAAHLRSALGPIATAELYSRFVTGSSEFDCRMRRVIFRALCVRIGMGLRIAPGVVFEHLETFEFGSGVFIGAAAVSAPEVARGQW